jgi:hypothetical protein
MGAAEAPAGALEDGGGRGKTDAGQASLGEGVQAGRFSSPEVELGRGGCGRERQGPGGEVEVLEDGAGGGGEEDAGHDAPVAAAVVGPQPRRH